MIKSADDTMTVCPTIVTEDSMQAQHLAATLALYNLTKGQVRIKLESNSINCPSESKCALFQYVAASRKPHLQLPSIPRVAFTSIPGVGAAAQSG